MRIRLRISLLALLLAFLLAGCSLLPTPTRAVETTASTLAASAATTATIPPTSTLPPPTPEPTATATPLPVCTETTGQVEQRELPSSLLPGPLEVSVYTPPCYGWTQPDQPETRFPVLYLLHGQTGSDRQWIDLGLPSTADALIAAGQVQPFIAVLPYEEDDLGNPDQSQFGAALTGELIPWVDAEYRTCTERECRAIGGLSRGAAWSVRLGFTHPELFSAIGAHSLPPFYGDMNRLPVWLAAIAPEDYPRIKLDIGLNDRYLSPAAEFEDLLTHLRLPHEWQLNPGGHDAAYWTAHLGEYLTWYWGQEAASASQAGVE